MADDHDARLHERLCQALGRRSVTVRFRPVGLISPNAPTFEPREILFTVVVMVMLAMAPAYVGPAGYSDTALFGLVLVGAFWLRWLWQRQKQRALALLQRDVDGLAELWRFGALELRVPGRAREVCVSPTGDWRRFVNDIGTVPERRPEGND